MTELSIPRRKKKSVSQIDDASLSTRELVLRQSAASKDKNAKQQGSNINNSTNTGNLSRRAWFKQLVPSLGAGYVHVTRTIENEKRDMLESLHSNRDRDE